MSNGIKIRQNEKHSIDMLGAQRKLYNDAKRADTAKIWFSVLIPLVLSIVLLFLQDDSIIRSLSYGVSIFGVIVSFFAGSFIKKKKELAATIQQQFDVYVYGMTWNIRLFGKRKNLDAEIIENAKVLFNKQGEKEKLLNWYPEEVDKKQLEEAIVICQRENFWWDVGLRKRYKTTSIIVISASIITVIVLGIINHESVEMLLWRGAFIAPMVQWLLETIDILNQNMEGLEAIADSLNELDNPQMEELEEIQHMIFEHRKSCLAIPNIVYNIFKDNDEDKAHNIAQIAE